MSIEEPVVRVTLRDIYLQGVETARKVEGMTSTIEALVDQRGEIDRLEERLRAAEQALSAIGTPAPRGQIIERLVTVLLAAVALVVTLADKVG